MNYILLLPCGEFLAPYPKLATRYLDEAVRMTRAHAMDAQRRCAGSIAYKVTDEGASFSFQRLCEHPDFVHNTCDEL